MTRSNYPNFSLIIPNYNGAKFLPACLSSLTEAIHHCPNSQFEIIIVDNGSTDNSRKICQKFTAKFISLNKNFGFGYAVNYGAAQAKYPYLVVVNNDLTVAPNWFKRMSTAIKQQPQIACFYGLVLNHDGTQIESAGFQYSMSGQAINIDNGHPFHKSYFKSRKSRSIWGAPASLVIYQKHLFLALGGFDGSFFAYIEDVDLSYRLAQHGHRTLFVPTAISYHLGGGTSSRINYLREWLTFRNWFKLIHKNYTLSQKIVYFFPIVVERLRNFKPLLLKFINTL